MPRKPLTEARKLPQQERSRIAVAAILEATTHILTEEGYEKANTNRIAERAGVRRCASRATWPTRPPFTRVWDAA